MTSRKLQKTKTNWFFTVSLILVLILVFLLLFFQFEKDSINIKFIELVIQIYGGFVGTLIGVYISIIIARKQQQEKETSDAEKVMLGFLKIIWSEFDINERIFDRLLWGVKQISQDVRYLYRDWDLIAKDSESLKSQAYYGAITAGAIIEISKHEKIFNGLQQAYYNTELVQNSLKSLKHVFIDFIDTENLITSEVNKQRALKTLSLALNQMASALKLSKNAKKHVSEYLTSKGIIFIEQKYSPPGI